SSLLFFLTIPRPPRYTLFPYTTLFRSFLVGCNQESNELTKEELETIYREEVQKELEKAKKAEETEVIEEDSANVEAEVTPESSRSEEHTSELQSRENLVCRLLLEKKKI